MATNTGIIAKALGREPSVDQLNTEIAELHAGIISGQEALGRLEAERAANLQDWLAGNDKKLMDDNAAAAVKARDTIFTLEQRRAKLQKDLHEATVVKAERALEARWDETRKKMKARAALIAKAESLALKLAEVNVEIHDASADLYYSLPVTPASPPPTFGNNFASRLNLFLFSVSEGRLGIGGVSVAIARKQPTLIELDAEVQKMLLKPLEKEMS